MGLYLYTNLNVMFEYLERNLIAPDSIVHEPHGYRTIGTASAHCLFVTHHRLNRTARMQGMGPGYEYPITLEISDPVPGDGTAILVTTGPDGTSYHAAPLTEYDEAACVGAFVVGEIPWSRVEIVYFDTKDDQIGFVRASSDYWYPEDRYAILPGTFTEEWSFESDDDALLAALDAAGIVPDAVRQGICDRERMRAGVLGAVNGTAPWQMGEYRFSVDPVLQRLLGVNDAAIGEALPHYAESIAVADARAVEGLSLFGTNTSEHVDGQNAEMTAGEMNQQIYDAIIQVLRRTELDHHRTPVAMTSVLQEIKDAFIAKSQDPNVSSLVSGGISAISALITGESDRTPEEIARTCPISVDVLSALLYVAKNPNSYEDFIRSLEVYRADQRTQRRAMALWGELNGLYGVPGEGYHKDNRALWQFIESYAAEISCAGGTLFVTRPDVTIVDGKLLGIEVVEERMVTPEDIRQVIRTMPRGRLDARFYAKLLEAVSVRKKAKRKDYTQCVASVDLGEIHKGTVLTDDILKRLKQLIEDSKDKNAVPDRERLYADYVEDEQVFAKVYAVDPEYWKSTFGVNKAES